MSGTDIWLKAYTGHSCRWWMRKVQTLIGKYSHPGDDPNHDETDVHAWLDEVIEVIIQAFPTNEKFDENMRTASVLSVILALWYTRVQRAKCDESQDAVYFPGQKWDLPYVPGAQDGTFV